MNNCRLGQIHLQPWQMVWNSTPLEVVPQSWAKFQKPTKLRFTKFVKLTGYDYAWNSLTDYIHMKNMQWLKVNLLKLAWKNSRNYIKWHYFWHVFAIWNYCVLAWCWQLQRSKHQDNSYFLGSHLSIKADWRIKMWWNQIKREEIIWMSSVHCCYSSQTIQERITVIPGHEVLQIFQYVWKWRGIVQGVEAEQFGHTQSVLKN